MTSNFISLLALPMELKNLAGRGLSTSLSAGVGDGEGPGGVVGPGDAGGPGEVVVTLEVQAVSTVAAPPVASINRNRRRGIPDASAFFQRVSSLMSFSTVLFIIEALLLDCHIQIIKSLME